MDDVQPQSASVDTPSVVSRVSPQALSSVVTRTAAISVAPQAAIVTPPSFANPIEFVAGVVSNVVGFASNLAYAALASFGPATPSAPSQMPILTAVVSLVRREFEQLLAIGSPAVSAGQAAFTAQFAGVPSVLNQLEVAGLRLGEMFGVNAESLLTPLIESNSPPPYLTFGLDVQSSEFEGTQVYTITPLDPSGKVVVAIHGGAYVVPPTLLHWLDYTSIARDTGATVVVPIYDLATAPAGAGTAGVVVPLVADLISQQIADNGAENVSVTGDSAGGGIALSAVQYLVANGKPVPSHLVLLSPSLDVSLTNPNIQYVSDPVLNIADLQTDGNLFAGTGTPYALPLNDYEVSPLFGSLAGLPPTAVYSGSLDTLSPDALVLQQDAAATPGSDFTFDLREGEIHDWALAPLSPEAIAVRPVIYHELGLE